MATRDPEKVKMHEKPKKDYQKSVKYFKSFPKVDVCMPEGNDEIHIAAKNGNLNKVEEIMKQGTNSLQKQNAQGWTGLHFACENGNLPIVKCIIGRIVSSERSGRSHVNYADKWGQTALHIAAMEGNVEVARLLIENKNAANKADVNLRTIWDDTALRAAVRHGQAEMMEFLIGQPMEEDPLLLHLACLHGSSECVRLLIGRGVGVNYTANLDEAENINKNFDTIQDNITPIDLAINYGHRLVVEVLISSNKLMEMMEHARVEDNKPTTPIRELIQNMPDLASKVFDNDESGKLLDDFKLIGNWMPGPSTNFRRTMFNHPLLIMVKNKREHLLGHKLVNTLVQKKWKEYGLPFLITNVVLQILFLVFITIFIVKTPAPVNGNSSLPNYNQSAYEHGQDAASSNQPQAIAITLIVFMLLILCYHVLIEVVQFWCLRLEYFDWDKLFSWIFYLTSLMFLVPALFCLGRPKPWMWEFGSCAVVFAWLQMLMVIRMNKHFGLYVVMFLRIFKTFISVFLTFLCVLIGFAFAFYMLLANQDTFGSFWYSLATTLVMMTGEFNYSDIFLTDEAELYYKPASYILFILFLILVFIIFMNLLVALAIGDIREELEKANLTKKALQVELSLRVEFHHPSWLRWNCLQKFTNSCCPSFSQEETPIVAPPQYDIEMVVKELQDFKRQMTMLTNQMMQLQTMIANNSQQ